MDGGKEAAELLNSTDEPWNPLTRYIISENPFAKVREPGEIEKLKIAKDLYSVEYFQSKCMFTI